MKEAPERVPNRNGLRYSASDKLKAVKLYLEEGYQVKAIVRELGIGKSSLGKWIREYREKGSGAFTSPPEKSAAEAEKSDPAREYVRAQILEHKAVHPDHGVKRITQIFRRFLGLPVKTHEVRAVLQAHPSSSTVITSLTRRSPAPMRFFERRSPNELWHTDVMYFIFPAFPCAFSRQNSAPAPTGPFERQNVSSQRMNPVPAGLSGGYPPWQGGLSLSYASRPIDGSAYFPLRDGAVPHRIPVRRRRFHGMTLYRGLSSLIFSFEVQPSADSERLRLPVNAGHPQERQITPPGVQHIRKYVSRGPDC